MTVPDKNSNKETPDARALILDLLAARANPAFDVSDLLKAGRLFDLSPEAVRAAIARLKREGRLKSVGRGRYAEGDAPGPWRRRIDGWRGVLARREPWREDWFLAALRPTSIPRTAWRRTLRALDAEGFRQTPQGPWLRPGNLAGGLDACRDRLMDLGAAPNLMLARADGLVAAAGHQNLWDVTALDAEARRHLDRLSESAARLDALAPPEAARESLLLGRAAVRVIVLDPLLPESWAGSDALSELIILMSDYQRRGVRVWAAYLAEKLPSDRRRTEERA